MHLIGLGWQLALLDLCVSMEPDWAGVAELAVLDLYVSMEPDWAGVAELAVWDLCVSMEPAWVTVESHLYGSSLGCSS